MIISRTKGTHKHAPSLSLSTILFHAPAKLQHFRISRQRNDFGFWIQVRATRDFCIIKRLVMGVVLIAKSLVLSSSNNGQGNECVSRNSPWKRARWFEERRERMAFQKSFFFIFIDGDVSWFPLRCSLCALSLASLFFRYDGSLSHVPRERFCLSSWIDNNLLDFLGHVNSWIVFQQNHIRKM